MSPPAPRRVDAHHHVVPPDYADWLRANDQLAGGLPIPSWSVRLLRHPSPARRRRRPGRGGAGLRRPRADGVVLLANHRGTYLGDPGFDPLLSHAGGFLPYAPAPVVSTFIRGLEAYPLDDGRRRAIDRGAAEILFPRLVSA